MEFYDFSVFLVPMFFFFSFSEVLLNEIMVSSITLVFCCDPGIKGPLLKVLNYSVKICLVVPTFHYELHINYSLLSLQLLAHSIESWTTHLICLFEHMLVVCASASEEGIKCEVCHSG